MADGGRALSASDRQIVDWVEAGVQHAEIAVRLGLSIDEVKRRIGRLESLGKLGARRGTGHGRLLSRRSVLAGAGGLGLAAAGAFGLSLRGGGEGRPGAGDDPDGSPTPPGTTRASSATATVIADREPHPGLAVLERDPARWRRVSLPTGGEITLEHGSCFIDTTDGTLDVLSFEDEADAYGPGGWGYDAYEENEFVSVSGRLISGWNTRSGLFDRVSGEGFSWPADALRLTLADRRLFVFAEIERDQSYLNNPFANGRFHVTSRDLTPLGSFDTGVVFPGERVLAALTADGRSLFVAGLADSLPRIVDLVDFTVQVPKIPAEVGSRTITRFATGPELSTVSVLYDGKPGPLQVTFSADGKVVALMGSVPPPGQEQHVPLISPDSRFALLHGTIRSRPGGMGPQEDWVYTEIYGPSSSDQPFRLLSGWLWYGLGPRRRWLADSSAFIVRSGSPEAPLESWESWSDHRPYYLVSPSGELTRLPDVPDELREDNHAGFYTVFGGPEPSPDDSDLMVFGRTAVYNRATGDWFGPGSAPYPDETDDPWGGGSREARFRFPIGGKGYASPATILPPFVEHAPYRREVTLVVTRAGDCLNLRTAPAVDAEILDCLPDGTPLRVTDSELRAGDGGERDARTAFWVDYKPDPSQAFVHVELEDARRGWVAIQYLDWASVRTGE